MNQLGIYLDFQFLLFFGVFDGFEICLVFHLWRLLEGIKVLPYMVLVLLSPITLGASQEGLRPLRGWRRLFLLSGHHGNLGVPILVLPLL